MATPHDTDVEPAETPALDWQVACVDADRAPPKQGLERKLRATEAECRAIAEALDILACMSFAVRLTVRARAGGRYFVTGRFDADIEQACVVTLEPIRFHLSESFAGEFCPAADLAQAAPPDAYFDPDGADEPMPVRDGLLDVGQLAYEHLALAVDPFPRRADAEPVAIERGPAGGPTIGSAQPGQPNPFAALAKLKLDKED